jgi:histidinol phosphatase-like PHP family hydrolase
MPAELHEVTARLREIASLLDSQAGNRYKVRAYSRGARALESSKIPLETLVTEQKLEELRGIGKALAKTIEELYRTGTTELLESLRAGTHKERIEVSPNKPAPKIRLYDGLRLAERITKRLRSVNGVSAVELIGPVGDAVELAPSLDLHVNATDIQAAIRAVDFAALESRTADVAHLQLADGTRINLEFGNGQEIARNPNSDLITAADICGFVHCHSTWSDGKDSILEMARAAEAWGAKFITITDHSKTAFYARGLDEDRLKQQWDEIAAAQEHVKIRILRGTESDILADGALDFPDHILEQLDVVIASIHNRYKQDEKAMTERVLRAMRWPGFKIWGHPLGRLVPMRPPIPLRVEEALDALASSCGAIEINGDPMRMDLEPRWARAARERGLPFVLSVDAHSTQNLDFLRTAVALARAAGITKKEVLNARDVDAFTAVTSPRNQK